MTEARFIIKQHPLPTLIILMVFLCTSYELIVPLFNVDLSAPFWTVFKNYMNYGSGRSRWAIKIMGFILLISQYYLWKIYILTLTIGTVYIFDDHLIKKPYLSTIFSDVTLYYSNCVLKKGVRNDTINGLSICTKGYSENNSVLDVMRNKVGFASKSVMSPIDIVQIYEFLKGKMEEIPYKQ